MHGAETHLSTPGFRTFCAQANTGGAAGGAEIKWWEAGTGAIAGGAGAINRAVALTGTTIAISIRTN